MFQTPSALWEICVAIWDTGNQAAKWALLCIVMWPIVPILYGLSGWDVVVINALIGLIPAVAFLTILITRFVDPLVLAVLASVKEGRKAVQWLFTIVAGELAIGLYFTLVPVANNRPLIPVFVLTAITLIFFILGVQGKWVSKAKTVLILMLFGINGSFFYDWTGGIQKWLAEPKELKEIPVLFREDGHFEDGLYINPQKTTVKKYATRENKVERNDGFIKLLYNCNTNMKIADIEPHKAVEIVHVLKQLDMDNRCSYSYTGDFYPITGAIGQVARPKFRNDIPFPEQFPIHAVVFQLRGTNGVPLEQDYIHGNGRSLGFMNVSNAKAELWVIYNYMSSFQNEQVGWDGSTASFTIKIASQ